MVGAGFGWWGRPPDLDGTERLVGPLIGQPNRFLHGLTHPFCCTTGEPPIYENKGPYVFDRKYKRVGVEFEVRTPRLPPTPTYLWT